MLQMNFILIPYFDWLQGPLKGQIFNNKNNTFLRNCMKLILCIHLYKDFFCSSQIRTLVALITFSLQRLIMGKVELAISAVSFRIFEFCFCINIY